MTGAPLTLGWTPLIDPIDAHGVWYLLLVPLCLLISVAYKAARCGDMRRYPRQVLVMTAQVLLGMVLLAVATFVVLTVIVPVVTPMPGP